jgi:hypothetical protein
VCDYSLFSVENRLAEEGEELILHKFQTGTLGFMSRADLCRADAARKTNATGFWSSMRERLFGSRGSRFPAVCVPPGARLLLADLPLRVQRSLRIGSAEVVVFTEISDRSYSYRDALLLPNSTRVLLQDLPEGIHAVVLSMSSEPSTSPLEREVRAA